MKHGILMADTHCGHRAGLTHPDHMSRDAKWHDIQVECWDRYMDLVERLSPVDFVIQNGDGLDGRGERSGGSELIVGTLAEQCEMNALALAAWKAPVYILSRGTDYHTGWGGEDWEDIVAEKLRAMTGAKVIIKNHPFVEIEGVTFDVKHHVGSSSVPHTGGTALLRDKTWNEQWYLDGEGQPLGDVILRAHAHWFEFYGGMRGKRPWVAIRQPALQAAGTKYGGRRCSRTVHWGLISLKVENAEFEWTPHIANVAANKVKAVRL